MSIFCFKKLPPSTSLGQQLKKRREERSITIADIASATHIQKKYLLAIEQGDFRKLPTARTFRLAYAREYAHLLGLNADDIAACFVREGGLEGTTVTHPHRVARQFPFASLGVAARLGLIAGGVLLFGVYLTGQVIRIVRPPRLMVYTPLEGEVINQMSASIQGQTEQESKLTINGEEAMVYEQGNFDAKVDLGAGVNTITILAQKRHGKTTMITRHLVVKQPQKLEIVSLK